VAPATRIDGSSAVLKIGMPHMEGMHELHGLRFWNGDGMVRLLEADEAMNAMLLERCVPGSPLRSRPENEQDVVIAGLLRRLWREPPRGAFRPLGEMLDHWSDETRRGAARWLDAGLVNEGLRLFKELTASTPISVLLVTDLHAGNVLAATREPWLAIDPKPFVGDPAYDATQHLFNCQGRMRADPWGLMRRMAELLEVDYERVRLWTFARAAAEPRDDWSNVVTSLARAVAP
jgi:streptomycin 6-kinase